MSEQEYRQLDKYDRKLASLANLPDVTHTNPHTTNIYEPFLGAQTFIIQTYRQKDGDHSRDTVFLQYVDDKGSIRLVIPHKAVEAIVRQREVLTSKVRRRIGKESAAARKARGELPGFMKGKKK